MALSIEIDGAGVRKIDTTGGGNYTLLDLKQSVTVTEITSHGPIVVADGATDSALNFGGVSAAKVLAIKSDGAVSIKVNASATALPINGAAVVVDSAGGITACTITNASGASRTVTFLVAG